MIDLTNVMSIKEVKKEVPNAKKVAIKHMKKTYKIILEA